MNTTKHTPGPWAFHLGRGAKPRFHIQTTAGYQIASTTELVRHSSAHEENVAREANARLIAAAPDLLEAIEKLLSDAEVLNRAVRSGFDYHDPLSFKVVRAIIAKAKGEQP